jgi:cytochrome P450
MYPKSHDNFKMIGPNSPFLQFIGLNNLAFANGHTWKKQRKLMNPVFHRSMPVKMMSSVLLTLFSVIEKKDGTIPIAEAMKHFTLDVLGYTIFGKVLNYNVSIYRFNIYIIDFDFKALNGDPDDWTKTYHLVNEALADPILNVFPSMGALLLVVSPAKRRRMAAIDKLNRKLDEMAQKKRREIQKGSYSNRPDSEKDLLTLMLEAENNGEGLLSDTELRHNLATFFLAGK